MPADNAPYETERDAHAAAVAAIPPDPGWVILSPAQRHELLNRALSGASVETSAFEDRTARWLTTWEDYTVAIIAGWVRRAYEAGKAAGPDRAVTAWGFRYESEGSPPVFMSYPLEDVQQMSLEFPPGPGTVRTAVARQVGPWAEAEIPAFVACRYCLGPVIACEPPHEHPACKGWKHAARLSMGPVGAHYCEGRSVNPSAEPRETEGDDAL